MGSKEESTRVQLSHKIGHISDPSSDTKAAIEEFEIRSDFPTAVIEEAATMGSTVSTKALHDEKIYAP